MGAAAVRGEIARLEVSLQEAVQQRDMPALELLVGQEFSLTTGRPGAERRGRQEWLEVTRDRYTIESFSFANSFSRTYS